MMGCCDYITLDFCNQFRRRKNFKQCDTMFLLTDNEKEKFEYT
jgi:hypothetical protein